MVFYCDGLRSGTGGGGVRGVGAAADPRRGRAGADLLTDVDLVALHLPQSLAALDEIAEAIARHAASEVRLVAGGRTKHMTLAMNEVLRRHFGSVRASLGAQKCRVLLAEGPLPVEQTRRAIHSGPIDEDLDLWVCAHGLAFAGSSIDLGTRFLLGCLDRPPATARQLADLGCGTGILAVASWPASRPEAQVLAVDDSWSAVRSAMATAAANGVAHRVRVRRRGRARRGAPRSVLDLVVSNPPFHRGPAKDSATAYEMFAARRPRAAVRRRALGRLQLPPAVPG